MTSFMAVFDPLAYKAAHKLGSKWTPLRLQWSAVKTDGMAMVDLAVFIIMFGWWLSMMLFRFFPEWGNANYGYITESINPVLWGSIALIGAILNMAGVVTLNHNIRCFGAGYASSYLAVVVVSIWGKYGVTPGVFVYGSTILLALWLLWRNSGK